MTKKQKNALAEVLREALAVTDNKWDETKGEGAAYCYGYLIGVVKEAIYHLES